MPGRRGDGRSVASACAAAMHGATVGRGDTASRDGLMGRNLQQAARCQGHHLELCGLQSPVCLHAHWLCPLPQE